MTRADLPRFEEEFGRRVNKAITLNGQTNDVSYLYDGGQVVAQKVNGIWTS